MRINVPDSISAMVYQMKRPWLWTVVMELLTFGMLMLMTDYNDTYAGVAFASCACIGFVGVMPLVKHEENKAHYILAIIGGVLSQIWCLLVTLPHVHQLLIWWVFYVMYLPFIGRKWCLFAEIWAVLNILIIVLLHG